MKNCCQKSKKSAYFEWTYGLFGNNYKVATLSELYLTVTESSCKVYIPQIKNLDVLACRSCTTSHL